MSSLGNKDIMAKNIKRLMDLKGKDRNEICKDLGIAYTTFTDWINAKTYPRIDKIEKMANYFGVTKADLVEEPTQEEPTYYHDPEVARYVDMLHKSEGQRILLDASKDLNMEDLQFLATMAEKMRGNNNDDTGC